MAGAANVNIDSLMAAPLAIHELMRQQAHGHALPAVTTHVQGMGLTIHAFAAGSSESKTRRRMRAGTRRTSGRGYGQHCCTRLNMRCGEPCPSPCALQEALATC